MERLHLKCLSIEKLVKLSTKNLSTAQFQLFGYKMTQKKFDSLEWCLSSWWSGDWRCVACSTGRMHYKLVPQLGFVATVMFEWFDNLSTIDRCAEMHSTNMNVKMSINFDRMVLSFGKRKDHISCWTCFQLKTKINNFSCKRGIFKCVVGIKHTRRLLDFSSVGRGVDVFWLYGYGYAPL